MGWGWGGLLRTLQDELLICGAVTDLFSYLKVIVVVAIWSPMQFIQKAFTLTPSAESVGISEL